MGFTGGPLSDLFCRSIAGRASHSRYSRRRPVAPCDLRRLGTGRPAQSGIGNRVKPSARPHNRDRVAVGRIFGAQTSSLRSMRRSLAAARRQPGMAPPSGSDKRFRVRQAAAVSMGWAGRCAVSWTQRFPMDPALLSRIHQQLATPIWGSCPGYALVHRVRKLASNEARVFLRHWNRPARARRSMVLVRLLVLKRLCPAVGLRRSEVQILRARHFMAHLQMLSLE